MFFYADDENKSGQGSGQKDPALSECCNMTVECAYNGKETLQRRYHAAFDEDVRRSLSGGMNGHLPKPVNVRKLEELLFEFLG